MAKKEDFTAEEWNLLRAAPVLVMTGVAASDPGRGGGYHPHGPPPGRHRPLGVGPESQLSDCQGQPLCLASFLCCYGWINRIWPGGLVG
jgi:hypothetical protein